MSQAAYRTIIKISSTSTDFENESMVNIGNNTYQIVSKEKQILDRNSEIVVKVDDQEIDSNDYTIDYLFGLITFSTDQTGEVTISGKFIPVFSIVGANTYSLDLSGDILDYTNFPDANSNGGNRTKTYGINDVSCSVDTFYNLQGTYKKQFQDRETVLIEIKPNDGEEIIRGWFVIENSNNSGDFQSLETESMSFQLNGDLKSSFSWRNSND